MEGTRRGFMSAAGGAVVYSLVDGGFALKAAGPNDQIGLGFTGSGIRGTQLMGEFLKLPGTRPVIVADLYDGYIED